MNIPIYYPKKVKSFLLAYVLIYLSAIVLIPFVALFTNSFQLSWTEIIKILFHERCISAYKVSFLCSFLAAFINAVFGFIIAFSLVKFDFFGKKFFDSIVDFPFALPTAVAGLAYVDLYSKIGLFGRLTGLPLAYTKAGIVLVLCFVSLPFAVRTIQPVLQEMDIESEQAAISLGANSFQLLRYVIIPYILPAWITAFSLCFARSLAEYGSVVFISGNLPYKTEIAPLLITIKLEQFDKLGASVLGVFLLFISFLLLLLLNYLEKWSNYNDK